MNEDINITEMFSEYENHTLKVILGGHHNTIQEKGLNEGKSLEIVVKDSTNELIKAAFIKSNHAFVSSLLEKKKNIEESIEHNSRLKNEIQLKIDNLIKTHGGIYHFKDLMVKTSEELIDLNNERVSEQKNILDEYKNKIKLVEEEFDNIKIDENYFQNINNNTISKLLSLKLLLGDFVSKSNKTISFFGSFFGDLFLSSSEIVEKNREKRKISISNFLGIVREKVKSLISDEKKRLDLSYKQKIARLQEYSQLKENELMSRPTQIPTFGRSILYTFFTILIFLIEIPLHLNYTCDSLEIEEGYFKYFIAIGITFILGLASKLIFFNDFNIKKNNFLLRAFTFTTLIVLIFSIARLNSYLETSGVEDTKATLRMIIFSGLTSVLSIVGAQYYSLSMDSWSKRRIISSYTTLPFWGDNNFFKEMDNLRSDLFNAESITSKNNSNLAYIEDILCLSDKGKCLEYFENCIIQYQNAYNNSFEVGKAMQITNLFSNRLPIPSFQNNNN